jgi:hypothetical protein
MANCKEYQDLEIQEKLVLIGQLVHLLQNDSGYFRSLSSIVRSAAQNGMFTDVKILPDHTDTEQLNDRSS